MSSAYINRKQTTHDTLSLMVEGESHVLGNIVQSYLQERKDVISYVGYRKHHPLIDRIEIKARVNDNLISQNNSVAHPVVIVMKDAITKSQTDLQKLIESIEV